MLLFKEPSVEKKPTAEAPKPALAPKTVCPPEGTKFVFMSIILCQYYFYFYHNFLYVTMA